MIVKYESVKTQFREWIAKRMKTLRIEKGAEQLEVATYVGKMPGTYAAYEEARSEPSILTITQLCEFYNIGVDKFLEGCPKNSNN